MPGFLTEDDLIRLTGYVKPKLQAKELRRMGLEPFVSASGSITITWDAVEARARLRSGIGEVKERRGPRPDPTACA